MFFRADAATIIKVVLVAVTLIYLDLLYLPSAVVAALVLVMHEYFFVDGAVASLKNGLLYIILGAVILVYAQHIANKLGLSLEELSKNELVRIRGRTKSLPFFGATLVFSGILLLILSWFNRD